MTTPHSAGSQPETPASELANLASQLYLSARHRMSDDPPGLEIVGRTSWHGTRVDSLEAFARVSTIGALINASGLDNPTGALWQEDFQRVCARGFAEDHAHRWPMPSQSPQCVVEAASLLLAAKMAMGDEPALRFFGPLAGAARRWFRDALDSPTPDNNWHLFRYTIATLLAEDDVERTTLLGEAEQSAARIRSWHIERGWFADGRERSIDYYNSWSFHYYPELVFYLTGRRPFLDFERLSCTYAQDMTALLSGTPWPPRFGRSLSYRFAIAASLGAHQLVGAGCQCDSPKQIYELLRCVRWFRDNGAIRDGELRLGWIPGADVRIDGYSGPGASYWAGKALVGMLSGKLGQALPEHLLHPPPCETVLARTVLDGPSFDIYGSRNSLTLVNHGSVRHVGPGRAVDPEYEPIAWSETRIREAEPPARGAVVARLYGGAFEWRRGSVSPEATSGPWMRSRFGFERRLRWLPNLRTVSRLASRRLPWALSAIDPLVDGELGSRLDSESLEICLTLRNRGPKKTLELAIPAAFGAILVEADGQALAELQRSPDTRAGVVRFRTLLGARMATAVRIVAEPREA